MQALNVGAYTRAQVVDMLHSGNRTVRFRYFLLDRFNLVKRELTNILGGTITHNYFAEIPRTAVFEYVEDSGSIDLLNDRIRPRIEFQIEPGVWVGWDLGVFLLSSPLRQSDTSAVVRREVQAYDQTKILLDARLSERYAPTITDVETLITNLLSNWGIVYDSVDAITETLPVQRTWDPGTTLLTVVNDLLNDAGYESLWFDGSGAARSRPYVSPSARPAEYTYMTDETSVILPAISDSFDIFSVPNTWTLVVTQPDRDELIATYVNDSPDSPTSTVSRGVVVTDFRTETEATSQEALNAKVLRLAVEASSIYNHVELTTALMPHHEHNDILTLDHSYLDISGDFQETGWEMELVPGGEMLHHLRKNVPLV